METKFTPEPWVEHDSDHCPEEIWGDLDGPLEDGKIRGTLVCTVADGPAMFANISLIKAAPELLKACEALLQTVRAMYVEIGGQPAGILSLRSVELANAAIAKATA